MKVLIDMLFDFFYFITVAIILVILYCMGYAIVEWLKIVSTIIF